MAKTNLPATTSVGMSDEFRMSFEQAAQSMVSGKQTAEDIMLAVLKANDIDDILGQNVIGLKNIIGTPFTIHSASLNESDFQDGLPAYIVMQAEFDDGERVVITTGAMQVVAQVIRMHQLGAFPIRVSSKQADKPTEAGYFPISLVKAPERQESF